jgi:hypothetical protein
MKVVAPAPPQTVAASGVAGGSSSGRAGLYLAQVNRIYLGPNFGGSGGMTTDYKLDTEFHLLSADGRVYRGYGLPEVPGGQLRNFDFDAARRKDPGNVGTYTAQGDRVTSASATRPSPRWWWRVEHSGSGIPRTSPPSSRPSEHGLPLS